MPHFYYLTPLGSLGVCRDVGQSAVQVLVHPYSVSGGSSDTVSGQRSSRYVMHHVYTSPSHVAFQAKGFGVLSLECQIHGSPPRGRAMDGWAQSKSYDRPQSRVDFTHSFFPRGYGVRERLMDELMFRLGRSKPRSVIVIRSKCFDTVFDPLTRRNINPVGRPGTRGHRLPRGTRRLLPGHDQ